MSAQPFFNAIRRLAILLWPVPLAVSPVHGESLSGKDLATALHAGGHVILARHASSPHTAPDATQANADNVQHERQLDEEARSAARGSAQFVARLKMDEWAHLNDVQ